MKRSETKKQHLVNGKTLIVAIDIGKTTNMGYCRCPDGTELKSFPFHNTRQGFELLWEKICWVKHEHALKSIVVGFEATGAYAQPIRYFLKQRGVLLVQVNCVHSKRLRELQDNSPNKTDAKDPKVIADIIELGRSLTVIIPEGAAAELRNLTQARERCLTRRTALLNQLHDLVFVSFPEFLQVMKDVKSKSAQCLLKKHPLPKDIMECGVEKLTVELQKISRGKLGKNRAQALYDAARESIGVQDGRITVVLEIYEMLEQIQRCECFISSLKKEMSSWLEKIPYSKQLLSIKGVGEVTIAGLIGAVGDFRKFNKAAELLKHAGLALFEKSSGKHKGTRHITRRGNALMRKLLFFAALRTVRKGGIMYEHYHRYVQNGMAKLKALVAVSRKILCIMLALVRTRSCYQTGYQNQPASIAA
jgi:transposase